MVAGEPLDVLVKALASFKFRKTPRGMINVTAQLDRDLGPPFLRALMRVEAELLVHDADLVGGSEVENRTPDQRRADALVALVLRITEARTG
jgi:hypothetical protein